MVRAQAWRLRCEVRGDVIDFPYKPPQHNETIDVFYIKKKLCKLNMQQTNILVNMIAFYLNFRIYLTIIVETENVI